MTVSPAGKANAPTPPRFEIKSAQLPLVALLLRSSEWELVAADVLNEFGPDSDSPDFFDNDALVLDFSSLARDAECTGVHVLLQALRKCNLIGVAFRGEPAIWSSHLLELGLVQAPLEASRVKSSVQAPLQQTAAPEIIREIVSPGTMVVDKPLRSGQKVYARGADLIVLAMVNQGAEVVADGNIHVYAPLRGKAMAGARGNTKARIFSLCMEPELVSIAGVYRTSEHPLPLEIAALPAQVRLSDDGQEKLLFEPLKAKS